MAMTLRIGENASLLRCITCGSALAFVASDRLECTSAACGASFPVVDGAPVLVPASSVFAPADDETRHYTKKTTTRLRDFVFRVTPDLELKVGRGAERLAREVQGLNRSGRILVLNLGGKHAGAAVEGIRSLANVEVVELDFSLSPKTHAVVDPERLPLPSECFDVVVVDAVLEHVPNAAKAGDEFARVLRRDGLVFGDTPFLLPVHAGAFDFMRFTHRGHRRLFGMFDEIDSGISNGPAMALGIAIQQFALSFVSSQFARYAVKLTCRIGLFWLKYADLYLHKRESAYDGALAFYFLGRKREERATDQEMLSGYRGITPSLLNRPARTRDACVS